MSIDPLRIKDNSLHFPMPIRSSKTPQARFGGFCFSQRYGFPSDNILGKIEEDEGLNALS